jgi:hypothetical protein
MTHQTLVRSALFAVAAIGAATLATTGQAEARHFRHGLGLSISIGSGGGIGIGLRPHCGYLYRKALRSGSPYWWNRYEACRYGY